MKVSLPKHLLCAMLAFFATANSASTPLFDRLEIDGKNFPLFWPGQSLAAIPLPDSPRLREIRREGSHCSALNGPRGIYRFANGSLWLVGLNICGGHLPLQDVYPGMTTVLLAEWIDGDLLSEVGKPLCMHRQGYFNIPDETLMLKVHKGVVLLLVYKQIDSHPECRPAPPNRPPPIRSISPP